MTDGRFESMTIQELETLLEKGEKYKAFRSGNGTET